MIQAAAFYLIIAATNPVEPMKIIPMEDETHCKTAALMVRDALKNEQGRDVTAVCVQSGFDEVRR